MNLENGKSEEKKILSKKCHFAEIKDFQLRKQTKAKNSELITENLLNED
jgi:hypothetical protein